MTIAMKFTSFKNKDSTTLQASFILVAIGNFDCKYLNWLTLAFKY